MGALLENMFLGDLLSPATGQVSTTT